MRSLADKLFPLLEEYGWACTGAMMCADQGEPLHEFASNMQSILRDLEATIHNHRDEEK
jgi:hypothetical protein